ncbi:MAG TPA: SRPBCC family protein [Vicinamibacterales bacterium]|nr:SRPBCC family protein [Vicinamibacterales bacterium]
MTRNVSDWERVVSVAAGAALLYLATRRRPADRLATSTGLGLLARGIGGYCPVNAAVGRGSDRSNTKVALSGPRGVHVHESITIDRPPAELFRFWRDFSNLPRFMAHLDGVQMLSPTRSLWTAKAPVGMRVKWEADVINEIEGELIGWQSTENADVATAGSVRFVPAPGGTEIIVHLQYEPPAGKLGSFVASLFGEEPSQQIRADLQRLKAILETGEVPRDEPVYT